jgi:hypothetical protein
MSLILFYFIVRYAEQIKFSYKMGTLKDIIQGLGNTIGGHPRGYPG